MEFFRAIAFSIRFTFGLNLVMEKEITKAITIYMEFYGNYTQQTPIFDVEFFFSLEITLFRTQYL